MRRGAPYLCEQVCKPGSVFDSHLSKRAVAGALQPPRERTGRPIAPIAVLLRIEFTASDTLEPMGELLPRLSTLTSEEAVYLCCTFPEVAFGGRYPLSLPCGARTFLMNRLSPCPRNCLAYSQGLIVQDGAGKVNRRWENAADGAIRSALKQITQNPGGVILHCSDGIINIDRVMQIVDRRALRKMDFNFDIIALKSDGNLLFARRYKK